MAARTQQDTAATESQGAAPESKASKAAAAASDMVRVRWTPKNPLLKLSITDTDLGMTWRNVPGRDAPVVELPRADAEAHLERLNTSYRGRAEGLLDGTFSIDGQEG